MSIQINQLKKSFGPKTAVDIDSFHVNDGDILGLVGNNGAGKTTLFRCLLDLLKTDEGEVLITPPNSMKDGEDDNSPINPAHSEKWKDFTSAYIDEAFLIDFLTPEEYFQFIGKVNRISKNEMDERLSMFQHFMNGEIIGQKKLIRNLSAGNKQKVGIIAALLSKPQLLILDEPFNFLDPTSQNLLKHILLQHNTDTHATILISSHNLAHTIDISTRIALLEHGHIINDLPNHEHSAQQQLEDYFEA